MDELRIQKLRAEVLSQLDEGRATDHPGGLESRVAALEAAMAALQRGRPAVLAGVSPGLSLGAHSGAIHPSLQVLNVGHPTERCIMEPDKPCVQSHACRTFGH